MLRLPALRKLCRFLSLLLVLAPVAAGAAPSGSVSGSGRDATPASPLTPAEAQSLIAILNDPARRNAFTRTLTELVTASRAVAAKSAPAGLVPHSLGAEFLADVGAFGTNLAAQGRDATRAFRSAHEIGPWLDGLTSDPARRRAVIDSVWRLAVVIGVALLAVVFVERLLRNPVAALARLAAGNRPLPPPPGAVEAIGDPPAIEEDEEEAIDPPEHPAPFPAAAADTDAAEDTAVAKRRHLAGLLRLLHALRRIPFASAHFVLELLPVAAFLLVSAAFEFAGFVDRPESLLVVSAASRSFVIAGVLIGLVNTLFAPGAPSLRLLLVNERPARRVAFWTRLGISLAAFAFAAIVVAQAFGLPTYAILFLTKLVVLVEHVLLAFLIVASRKDVARVLTPPRRIRGAGRRVLSGLARRWWLYALFFNFAFWVIWAAELRDGYARLWTFTVETAAVVIVARIVAVALLGGLERLFHLSPDTASGHPWLQARADRYYPVLRRFVGLLVVSLTAVTLLEVWGLPAYAWFSRGALGGKLVGAVISALASIAIGILIWEAANTAVDRHLDRLRLDPAGGAARIARLNTLLPMLRILLFVFVATVVVLTILSEIGVNIAPLLGGAGIVGVAIGFGSQKLVQDFITGIFLLLENTMQVGDTITAGGLSGSVEHLSIRTMRLRAGDGSIHVIPFSSVSTVTNTNRGLGNAAVSVDIAPEEDPDRAGAVLKAIALDMREDEAFKAGMLSDLQYWGVNAVSGQAVTLAGQIACTDAARWGVQREFNRRMRSRFLAEGIRLARPQQHVTLEHEERPRPAVGSEAPSARTATVTDSPDPVALGHDG